MAKVAEHVEVSAIVEESARLRTCRQLGGSIAPRRDSARFLPTEPLQRGSGHGLGFCTELLCLVDGR